MLTAVLMSLFWGAVLVIVYTYLVFPALVWWRGLARRRPYTCADITPSVSMIIVAHNEAAAIGAKLENVLALDYPRDCLQVVVASDGSSDETNGIVGGYADRGVALLAMPRQGKIPALNAAAGLASGEILVFSDANSMFAPNALRALLRPLADPHVGGVAGNQCYLRDDGASAGERTYWGFDRRLKQAESAAGNTISATGAIYAIRRRLYRAVPSAVTDDFAVSTGVIAQGYRLVFAAEAVAYEPAAAANKVEFGRKVRVMTRGLRGVLVRRELLNPLRHGFYAVQLFSHKVLRRLVALPLLVLLAVSPLLWNSGLFYQAATLAQYAFYGCGIAGLLSAGSCWGRWKLLAIPSYFCLVNTAALTAAVEVVRGRRIELWEPQRAMPCGVHCHVDSSRPQSLQRKMT